METYQMHQEAFKDNCLLRTQAWRWYKARLKRRVARIRSDIKHSIKFSHNTPSNTAFVIVYDLARSQSPVVLQPSYSPDVAPSYFFAFPLEEKAQKKTLRVHGKYSNSCYKVFKKAFRLRTLRVSSRHGRHIFASKLIKEEPILKMFKHL